MSDHTSRVRDTSVKCTSTICDMNDIVICSMCWTCKKNIKAGTCRLYKSMRELTNEIIRNDLT